MKKMLKPVLSLSFAVVFTLALANGVAKACADIVIGAGSAGGVSCDLTGESGGYCHYSCDCGSHSYDECGRRMELMGITPVS